MNHRASSSPYGRYLLVAWLSFARYFVYLRPRGWSVAINPTIFLLQSQYLTLLISSKIIVLLLAVCFSLWVEGVFYLSGHHVWVVGMHSRPWSSPASSPRVTEAWPFVLTCISPLPMHFHLQNLYLSWIILDQCVVLVHEGRKCFLI